MLRSQFILGALAALLALAAPASAQVVSPTSVPQTVEVAAGAQRSATLRCPDASVALHGGPAANPSARVRVDSAPAKGDAGEWRFRFSSRAGGTARAVLRCLSLRLPAGVGGVSLEVSRVTKTGPPLAPGQTRRVAVDCLEGHVPTGWGLERNAGSAALDVSAALPGRRGWVFGLTNAGPAPAGGTLAIRCVDPVQRAATGEVHRLALRLATFTDPLASGGLVSHACRASEFSVSTGLSPTGSGFALAGTRPLGEHGGRWLFRGHGTATVGTSLICLDTGTRFG